MHAFSHTRVFFVWIHHISPESEPVEKDDRRTFRTFHAVMFMVIPCQSIPQEGWVIAVTNQMSI
jgi:hypothetical protein